VHKNERVAGLQLRPLSANVLPSVKPRSTSLRSLVAPLGAGRSDVSVKGERGLTAGALEQMAVPSQNEDAAVRVSELLGDRLDRDGLSCTSLVRRSDHQRGARVPEVVERQSVKWRGLLGWRARERRDRDDARDLHWHPACDLEHLLPRQEDRLGWQRPQTDRPAESHSP
jgi:hypothetical protein